jgi:hypothetical protein
MYDSNGVLSGRLRLARGLRGHLDTDDVLVIHIASERRWSIHRRQPSVEATLQMLLRQRSRFEPAIDAAARGSRQARSIEPHCHY